VTDDRAGDVQDSWNRLGQYMEAWAGYGSRAWARNQTLWAAVARNLEDGGYTADKAARDTTLAMAVMQRNTEDLWRVLTGSVETERYVKVLPTAFLFFDLQQEGAPEYALADPVEIPVPAEVDRDSLPEVALIALSGTATRPARDGEGQEGEDLKGQGDLSRKGVSALEACLVARLKNQRTAYVLETLGVSDDQPLVPGVYDGLVYLTKPPLPLANLRVIVEGPPPQV
jgi:hypothetical protein